MIGIFTRARYGVKLIRALRGTTCDGRPFHPKQCLSAAKKGARLLCQYTMSSDNRYSNKNNNNGNDCSRNNNNDDESTIITSPIASGAAVMQENETSTVTSTSGILSLLPPMNHDNTNYCTAKMSSVWSMVHPGHALFLSSLPFCFGAYRLYHESVSHLAEEVTRKNTEGKLGGTQLNKADDGVRRVVAYAMATRALKLATMGTIGVFGLLGAATIYATGWHTTADAIRGLKRWAEPKRKKLDRVLGIERSELETEMDAIRGMTDEEQYEYFSKQFLVVAEDGDNNNEKEEGKAEQQ